MNNYKFIELMTYVLFITGILLWDSLYISWFIFTISQLVHFIFSIVITVLILFPFIFSHIKKHKDTIIYEKQSYKKRVQTILGILIATSLFILVVSGFYLFFIGNRGGDIYGLISNIVHFYFSFLFLFLIIWHSYFLGRRGVKEDKKKLLKISKLLKKRQILC